MAISCTNECLRVFSVLSWKEQFTFDQSMSELTVNNTAELINIYNESDTSKEGSFYEAMQRPFKIPRSTSVSRQGLKRICFSSDAKFCATLSENTPKCVWVWDLTDYNLNSVLVQNNEVTDISWCPRSNNLNISTNNSSKLYLWSPKGASVCQVPLPTNYKEIQDLFVNKVVWNPNGQSFAALDKASLVFVFP